MKKLLMLSILPTVLCAVAFSVSPQDAKAAELVLVDGGFDYFECGDGTPMYCGIYDSNGNGQQVDCTWEQFGAAAESYCADHGGIASPGIVSTVLVTGVDDEVVGHADEDDGQVDEDRSGR